MRPTMGGRPGELSPDAGRSSFRDSNSLPSRTTAQVRHIGQDANVLANFYLEIGIRGSPCAVGSGGFSGCAACPGVGGKTPRAVEKNVPLRLAFRHDRVEHRLAPFSLGDIEEDEIAVALPIAAVPTASFAFARDEAQPLDAILLRAAVIHAELAQVKRPPVRARIATGCRRPAGITISEWDRRFREFHSFSRFAGGSRVASDAALCGPPTASSRSIRDDFQTRGMLCPCKWNWRG